MRRPINLKIFFFASCWMLLSPVNGFGFSRPLLTIRSKKIHPLLHYNDKSTRRNSADPVNGSFDGMPSSPGWKSGRLNRLTKWADSRKPNRPIICEYEPNGLWLWRRWKGTVLKSTWPSVVLAMAASLCLDIMARRTFSEASWALYSVPTSTDWFIQVLRGLRKVWEYHLTLTTFILTFFLAQSLSYWQKVYNTVRMIQGRINDYCMLITMGSQRGNDSEMASTTATSHRSIGTYTPVANSYTLQARDLVKTCTRLIRMSHIFFWACTPTASNGLNDSERFILDAENCPLPLDDQAGIGPVLLSPYGLNALVNTGQLTKEETQGLVETRLPPSQYAYVLLVWVGLHTMNGLRKGFLNGGAGLESNLLRQLTSLRASMFDIDDFRAGRMPLAYVQLVQVLVDSLVMVTPFALYPEWEVYQLLLWVFSHYSFEDC